MFTLRTFLIMFLVTTCSWAVMADETPSPEKANGIYGTVLSPDGKPLADVDIAMATHGNNWVTIRNGRLNEGREPYTVSTDKDGKFKFTYIDFEEESRNRHFYPGYPKADFLLLFLHDTGFKRIMQQDWESLDENKTVTLERWGRVEGTVKTGTQPGKNLPVFSQFAFSNDQFATVNEPHVSLWYETTADELGKFSFDRIPPSFVTVSRTINFNDTGRGYMSTSSHSADKIDLKPGETAMVTLGGVGRPVTGKLVPSKEFETSPDWTLSHIQCTPALEKVEYPGNAVDELREKMIPKEILEETADRMKEMELHVVWMKWMKTEEGKKFQTALDELTKDYKEAAKRNNAKRAKRRVCAVAKDGSFRLDDIFEGDWTLNVQLDAPPPATDRCGTGGTVGTLEYSFSVAAIPGGVSDEPLDIGTLEVKQLAKPNPMPKVGDTAPEFEIAKIEPIAANGKYENKNEKLRLSDYKGKYVILDFWATWCGPCLAKLPELKTLYEKIKDDDRVVMIGISLDAAGSEEMLGQFVGRREMPWLHGLSGDWQSDTARSYGVDAIPALLLIDTDGKVLMSNPGVAELTQTIEKLIKQ